MRGPAARRFKGQDVVIHFAFMSPPRCLNEPDESEKANVGGTSNLISAIKSQTPSAKLLFASTLDVYGHTTHLKPGRRVTDPVQITDIYSAHKIRCESMLRESGLTWAIMRFADLPPLELRTPVPLMFEIPPTQRIEAVHPKDAAVAVARAISLPETWHRT
jgi:nucleoside-diphosphate-sugar epimerase